MRSARPLPARVGIPNEEDDDDDGDGIPDAEDDDDDNDGIKDDEDIDDDNDGIPDDKEGQPISNDLDGDGMGVYKVDENRLVAQYHLDFRYPQ